MTDHEITNLKNIVGGLIELVADTRRRLTNLTVAFVAMKDAISEADLPKVEAAYRKHYVALASDKFAYLETPHMQSLLRDAEKFRQNPLAEEK